jgi:hypothetical protein
LCRLLLPVWGYLAWYSPRWHWRLLYSFRIVQCLLLDLVAFCLHSVLWIYVSSFALSSFYPWSKLLLECIGKSFGHVQCWVVSVKWSVLSGQCWVVSVECTVECVSVCSLGSVYVWLFEHLVAGLLFSMAFFNSLCRFSDFEIIIWGADESRASSTHNSNISNGNW